MREHSLQKVPVILVLGRREAEQRTITVRRLGIKQQESLELDEAIARLVADNAKRGPGHRIDMNWGPGQYRRIRSAAATFLLMVLLLAHAGPIEADIELQGDFVQGGMVVGRTAPGRRSAGRATDKGVSGRMVHCRVQS